ncbi:MAG: YfbU family protein [Hyphomicrobiaceae bacterium]
MKLSDGEKLILVMLSDIHEKLGIKNSGVDGSFVRDAITTGNAWGLKERYHGVFGTEEADPATLSEVRDILEMWVIIETAYKKLPQAEKARIATDAAPSGSDVKFGGFDGNSEIKHMIIARFLIERLEHWTDFAGRNLNSHYPSLGAYRRMLKVWGSIKKGLLSADDLTADQIVALLNARRAD